MPSTLRRQITRAELDAYYARHEDRFWDFAIPPIYDNPRLAGLSFDDPTHEDYARLTRAQQVIIGLNTVDGQIENGGLEQLVFNYLPELPWLRSSVIALGHEELSRRFEATLSQVFDEETVAKLRFDAHTALAGEGSHEKAWAHFQVMYRDFDCEPFNDWYCAQQNHAAIMDTIERYIRANEAEIFEISDR